MSAWYFTRDGKTKNGPFTDAQLKELARSGQLHPTDMVRSESNPKWMQVAQVNGLFGNGQVPAAIPAATNPVTAPSGSSPSSSTPPLPLPLPGSSSGDLPWWRRLLDETKEVGKATWAQITRLAKYWSALWQGRSLRRDATDQRVAPPRV